MKRYRYWTKERCAETAKKHDSRNSFRRKYPGAYCAAQRNGWLDEIFSHVTRVYVPKGYWTKEKVLSEAKNFKFKSDFERGCKGAYDAAHRNGWIDEACKHMGYKATAYKRYVYAIEFEDKSVYVGLTWDLNERFNSHFNLAVPGNKHIKENLTKEIGYTVVSSYYKYVKYVAAQIEGEWVEEYRNDGWRILNIANPGALGGGSRIQWTKPQCIKEAKKYRLRSEFHKGSCGAYGSARKNGWLEEVCKHMDQVKKPNDYWTKKRCAEEASKYETRREFNRGNPAAYSKAKKKRWVNSICKHMDYITKPPNYWTKKRCAEEAKKFNRRGDFWKESNSAYNSARRNGWLDCVCKHMN